MGATVRRLIAVFQYRTSMLWHLLRMSRSRPPGLAGMDNRRADLYRASLQQFEELLSAAASIGPAGSPLPLYYALNQAGRAVLAACEADDSKVFVATNEHHGLTLARASVGRDLLDALSQPVRPDIGHFQKVAAATGSPLLAVDSGVPLGALIASLPEADDESFDDDTWPTAVRVHPLMRFSAQPSLLSKWDTDSMTSRTLFSQGVMQLGLVTDSITSPEDLACFAAKYPALVDRQATLAPPQTIPPSIVYWQTPAGLALEVRIRVQRSSATLEEDHEAALNEVAPQYRWLGRRWLRPSVEDGRPPPTSLMTWWAVLHALSMLARYYPTAWTAALSIDQSTRAALLERTLALALDALPHLVFEAVGLVPGGGSPPTTTRTGHAAIAALTRSSSGLGGASPSHTSRALPPFSYPVLCRRRQSSGCYSRRARR